MIQIRRFAIFIVIAVFVLSPISAFGQISVVSTGSSFGTAQPFPRELLGQEFSIDKHLNKKEGVYFTLDIKAGDSVTLYTRTTNKGVKLVDGELVERDDGKGCTSKIELYNYDQVKGSTFGARNLQCNKEDSIVYTPVDQSIFKTFYSDIDQTIFIEIGNEKNYRISKANIYKITLEYFAEPQPEPQPQPQPEPQPSPPDTPPADAPATTDTSTPSEPVVTPPPLVQDQPKLSVSKVVVILDASGSMNGRIGGRTKFDIAKEALEKTLADLPSGVEVGLRVYGNNFSNSVGDQAQSCVDSQFLVGFTSDNAESSFGFALSNIEPKSWTPLAFSLDKAGDDLVQYPQGGHTIILISDGEETCGGNPTSVISSLKDKGIKVVTQVIGFDVASQPQAKKELEDIAKAGDGQYFPANDSKELEASLREIFSSKVPETVARFANEPGIEIDEDEEAKNPLKVFGLAIGLKLLFPLLIGLVLLIGLIAFIIWLIKRASKNKDQAQTIQPTKLPKQADKYTQGKKYVTEQRKLGKSDAEIRKSLKSSGWQDSDINNLL